MSESDLNVYREAYRQCLEAGDDQMNAKLRLREMGATEEEADAVVVLENVDEPSEDNE